MALAMEMDESMSCAWGMHGFCRSEVDCGCHCHDLIVLGHHPDCDGECVECPVLIRGGE